MALSDIILPYPYVLVAQSASTLGILPIGGNITFGVVVLVYSGSDRIAVDQTIMFDVKKSQEFIYGSTIYNLVSAEFVSGQEAPLP